MANCPKCGVQVQGDFGFSPCPSCGTMLNFDFEGNIKLSEDSLTAASDTWETPSIEPSFSLEEEVLTEADIDNVESSEIPEEIDSSKVRNNFSVEKAWDKENSVENWAEKGTEESWPEQELDSSKFEEESSEIRRIDEIDFQDFKDGDSTRVFKKEDLSEISTFANSSESSLDQGKLFYNLMISDVGTRDIRSKLQDILSDKKLLLDVDKLMTSICDGVLVIRRLNPVKASLIVNQIKILPVEIKWEQNDITEV